ncbi:MAG TPA: hypothetical protein VFR24_25265 [Candidatus Angelobacter sp.]|nr:hypothetical protein [Candidatus Angelobacter sp.]
MKKGNARPVVQRVEALAAKRKASILKKCHPALFELAPLWKASITAFQALGPNAAERVAEIEQEMEERLLEIHRKYSGPTAPAPDTFAAQSIFRTEPNMSDGDGVADWLHFERHKIPLKDDLVKRQQKEWNSTGRVLRTITDVERLRCGKRVLPFKGNLEHANMFENFWGFGLEKLSPDELADFFDWFCPCESEGHDGDALKKHRARFKRAIEGKCGG